MDDAKKVLSDASKKNGKYVPVEEIVLTKPSAAASKGSFTDIMRHPTLRIHTLIMYFNWFCSGEGAAAGRQAVQQRADQEDGLEVEAPYSGACSSTQVTCH